MTGRTFAFRSPLRQRCTLCACGTANAPSLPRIHCLPNSPDRRRPGERGMPLPGGCSSLRREDRAGLAGSGPLLARPTGAHLSRRPRLAFIFSCCRCPRRFPSARLLGAPRRPPAAGRPHGQHPVRRLSEPRGAERARARLFRRRRDLGPGAARSCGLSLKMAAARRGRKLVGRLLR